MKYVPEQKLCGRYKRKWLEKERGEMRKVCETADLFAIGGGVYGIIEIAWRGYTHWTMAVLGGVLFLILGGLNRYFPEGIPLLVRGLAGGMLITAAEFAAGCILNLRLGLDIWDYSQMPLHLWGQICLPYSLLWWCLSMIAMVLHSIVCCYGWNERAIPMRIL